MLNSHSKVNELDSQVQRGELSSRHYWAMVQEQRETSFWARFTERTLLYFGAAHLLLAVILLFTDQWENISSLTKLGVLGVLVLALALLSHFTKNKKTLRLIFLLSASILIGPWLGLCAQIYQVSFNSYEIILSWAILILPWTFYSKSQPHWVLFLGIFTIGTWLFSIEFLSVNGLAAPSTVTSTLIVFLCGILLISEGLFTRGAAWLKPFWGRSVLALAIVGHANYLAIRILDLDDLGAFIRMPFALFALILLTFLYGNTQRSLAGFAIMVFGWALFISAHFIRLAQELETLWIQAVAFALIAAIATATSAWVFNSALKRKKGP